MSYEQIIQFQRLNSLFTIVTVNINVEMGFVVNCYLTNIYALLLTSKMSYIVKVTQVCKKVNFFFNHFSSKYSLYLHSEACASQCTRQILANCQPILISCQPVNIVVP